MNVRAFLRAVLAGTAIALTSPMFPAVGQEAATTSTEPAAQAINALGLELLRQSGAAGANALLSPYSIQLALAMTYAGSGGGTRAEMARALHYGGDEPATHGAFAALAAALGELQAESLSAAARAESRGRKADPIQLTVANRLFGQRGFGFEPAYLGFVSNRYGAPLEPLDFRGDAGGATRRINEWVAERTRGRIPVIVPPGALGSATVLALVNAIHFKAAWNVPFQRESTRPAPFHVPGAGQVNVPTMRLGHDLMVSRGTGFKAVALPYSDPRLQWLILLPDAVDGWRKLEEQLTPESLKALAKGEGRPVELELPRLHIAPPPVSLGKPLQQLGLKSAFGMGPTPPDFSRMASAATGGDRLQLTDVLHRTYLDLDEKGTEAAAATAVLMAETAVPVRPREPLVIKVDRPFLFAIQHQPSGACLFIGRVTDPR